MKSAQAGILQKRPGGYTAIKDTGLSSVWLRYTILFCICASLSFLPYIFLGRSFVYRVDGASQYIVYLRYMGQFLRDWISGFFHGDFTPQMYDFSIGMGDDINAIVRFHPLDFLSVFVPGRYTEYLYDAILLIRYYLSGLSFCAFALYWKDRRSAGTGEQPYNISCTNVLSGAIVYVFCGYMLMRVMNHPTYASPFIILPLLLLGAEKVMEPEGKKGRILFPAAVFLGFVSNYYFMYICSIALLVYVLLRLPEYFSGCGSRSRGKAFFSLFFRMVFLYLIGLGMSMVTLLPTMIRYGNSFRTSQITERLNLLFYEDVRRYGAWAINLITPYVSSGNGTNLNFSVIVFPALISLFFFCRRRFRTLKTILALDLCCLLIPAGGYIMAVFNNENNRWMFLIALSLGMVVTLTADSFAQMEKWQERVLGGAGIAMLLILAVVTVMAAQKIFTLAAMAELAVCICALILQSRRGAGVETVRRTVLVITCISAVANAWITFVPAGGNTAYHSTKAGKAYRRYERNPGRVAGSLDMDTFCRLDTSTMSAGSENAGIYYGYNGTSIYNSIVNRDLLQTMIEEDNTGLESITHMQDLDGRFVTEALAGVRYYVTKKEGNRPYGFSQEPVYTEKKYLVYENECRLPFAVSYDCVISEDDYEKLDSVGKELVQLQAAVVNETDLEAGSFTHITQAQQDLIVEELALPEPFEKTQNGYRLKTDGEKLTLTYEKKQGYVCYLKLNALTCDRKTAGISVTSGTTKKKFSLRSMKDTYTLAREDYVIDLMAESAEGETGEKADITIRFKKKGTYDLESVEIIYIPVEELQAGYRQLSQEAGSGFKTGENRVSGSISLNKEKLVTFQILSQKGWKLYVDGAQTQLLCANNCYLGAVVPAGEHDILLVYETPGLKAGMCISLVSLLTLICLALYVRKHKYG